MIRARLDGDYELHKCTCSIAPACGKMSPHSANPSVHRTGHSPVRLCGWLKKNAKEKRTIYQKDMEKTVFEFVVCTWLTGVCGALYCGESERRRRLVFQVWPGPLGVPRCEYNTRWSHTDLTCTHALIDLTQISRTYPHPHPPVWK